ncbi:PREDICTED: mitogen-activated protein kinase kinase kinase YODA [Tarenaya hassleriana]|uniref:mitogen-activated protein kinase kinase kinase YODA n=1 Tax=Tarenaya hassleriana TaxID=28532 RepID=UPI00053C2247|nr:PREDICTED: mitogen-activated protein kinase kinase kinase YODA [Tarenaya hassleriana]
MEWVRRKTIGHGSFSTVSLATTTAGNSSPALPPVMAVKSSGVVGSAMLRNEKHVLDHLGDCPQIVRCFGDAWTVENGEEIYNLFLDYASGGSLADYVRKSGGSLPEFEVRRFTRTIVQGLRHIHANGFSHCDVKLDNILMFGDGEARISDFGLAKKMENETRSTMEETRVEIRGTPLYMAPESVNDSVFESPADIWALGCSVVEMASGKTAWCLEEGPNIMSLFFRIGAGDEVPRIPAELSEEGKDFLQKCFVRDPANRWTAEMLLDHPFVAVDEEKSWISPRGPFDFPEWISVQSSVIEPVTVGSPVNDKPFGSWESYSPPGERIRGIFTTEEAPDWSVSCDWVNVR